MRNILSYQYSISFFTLSQIFHSVGRQSGSWTSGKGVSQPVTRVMGARRERKHFSCSMAEISPPMPQVPGASWVMMHLPVLLTDLTRVSASQGQIVCRSIISQEIPSALASLRTVSRVLIRLPYPISVMSLPSFTTSAFQRARLQSPTGTRSSALRQRALGSKKMTGLGSLIEASKSPLAWIGSLGTTTLSPGVCAKQASGDCE